MLVGSARFTGGGHQSAVPAPPPPAEPRQGSQAATTPVHADDAQPPVRLTGLAAGRRLLPPQSRVAYVRAMFSAIAPRYDLTNTVISAGLHRRWKRETVRLLAPPPGARVLDVCCGTGDLARLLAGAVGAHGLVIGVDFAAPMVRQARRRMRQGDGTRPSPGGGAAAPIAYLVGDALTLPFPDATFDGVTVGFGLRNLADPLAGLRELRRVLRPGGRLAVLEFARVRRPLLRALYDLYSFTLLATLGRLVSRHPDAYLYLPVSVRHWPDQAGVLKMMEEAGFQDPRARDLAGGIVAVYTAQA